MSCVNWRRTGDRKSSHSRMITHIGRLCDDLGIIVMAPIFAVRGNQSEPYPETIPWLGSLWNSPRGCLIDVSGKFNYFIWKTEITAIPLKNRKFTMSVVIYRNSMSPRWS